MQINGNHHLAHSATTVFEAIRDKQAELVRYMPNIERCQVLERKEDGPIVELKNRWQATLDDVPRVARPFVSPELVSWFDYARWDATTQSCKWRIESVKAKDIFDCQGETKILADGDSASAFELVGNLSIHADRIPGVPKLLAGKVRGPMEKLIAASITPNLTGIARAVDQYLTDSR